MPTGKPSLCLHMNALGMEGLKVVMDCLKNNTTLTLLNLGGNNWNIHSNLVPNELGEEGEEDWESEESAEAGRAAMECLRLNTSLTMLDLRGNNISEFTLAWVESALKANKTKLLERIADYNAQMLIQEDEACKEAEGEKKKKKKKKKTKKSREGNNEIADGARAADEGERRKQGVVATQMAEAGAREVAGPENLAMPSADMIHSSLAPGSGVSAHNVSSTALAEAQFLSKFNLSLFDDILGFFVSDVNDS